MVELFDTDLDLWKLQERCRKEANTPPDMMKVRVCWSDGHEQYELWSLSTPLVVGPATEADFSKVVAVEILEVCHG